MKYIHTLLPAFLAVFVAGCASPKYNYRPVVQEVSKPSLHVETLASVGDEMLRQGIYTERDAIKLTKVIKIGMLGAYTLTPGYYVKVGEDKVSEYYEPAVASDGGRVQKGALSDPWKSIQLSKKDAKIAIVTILNLKVATEATGVIRTKYLLLTDESFQQTLIYSGKFGNKIRVGYREFSNNVARPAFSNDVEYDLSESRIIGYKGARIEVLDATNESMRYIVLHNFNQAVK